jgi:basic amino acid/polyamine antiporter, APA family
VVREPARVLPRAILVGVSGVIVVYLLVNLAFLRVLGPEGLAATGPGFASLVAERTFGPGGGRVLAAAMAVSAAGVCTVPVLATPWIYVAMARERLFFAPFAQLHPQSGAPTLGLLTQAALAIGYLLLGQYLLLARGLDVIDYLTGSVVFAEWIFHALAAWGLLRLRRLRPDLPRPFRTPTFFPLLYLALALTVIAGNLLEGNPYQTGTGLVVLALGALAYRFWQRPNEPAR